MLEMLEIAEMRIKDRAILAETLGLHPHISLSISTSPSCFGGMPRPGPALLNTRRDHESRLALKLVQACWIRID